MNVSINDYNAILNCYKRFEVVKGHGTQEGDHILLREWDGNNYTGRKIECVVTYVQNNDEAIKDGYSIVGIRIVPNGGMI